MRRSARLALTAAVFLLGACVSRPVRVPPVLPATHSCSLPDLVERVNRRSAIESLTARADLQFETGEGIEAGILRRYRNARGRIVLSRPDNIRLQIEAPVLGVSIAEMASDGEQFELILYPEEYRVFIIGSNDEDYSDELGRAEDDPRLEAAGPLVNIRPQHFTAIYLYEPLRLEEDDTIVVMEEARLLEEEDRPQAEDRHVVRSYCVLTEIRRGEDAPRRKFWFDRTSDLAIARQQIFDANGVLVGEARFSNYFLIEDLGVSLPVSSYLERPKDRYALRIQLDPATLSLDQEVPTEAFHLELPEGWGASVRTIDLDQPHDGR